MKTLEFTLVYGRHGGFNSLFAEGLAGSHRIADAHGIVSSLETWLSLVKNPKTSVGQCYACLHIVRTMEDI